MNPFSLTNEERSFIRAAIEREGEVKFEVVGDTTAGFNHNLLTGYLRCAMQSARVHDAISGRHCLVKVTRELEGGLMVGAKVSLTTNPIKKMGGF